MHYISLNSILYVWSKSFIFAELFPYTFIAEAFMIFLIYLHFLVLSLLQSVAPNFNWINCNLQRKKDSSRPVFYLP